ncbi:DUF86 domain-containing protein [Anaerobacillus sp. HL2]|nr:DUF86 domain-containing protein [Anaerobacillus sp. HL2]
MVKHNEDPGSYEDIVEILLDEKKVISEKDAVGYKKVISLRTMVVRNYANIDHELIFRILNHYDNHKFFSFSKAIFEK